MLEASFLGQFELRLDGQSVALHSRPVQSLVAYLLLHSGKAQRREKLAGLLWPEQSEAAARHNVRQVLWQARRALGIHGHTYLPADDVGIAFSPQGGYWLDVEALQRGASVETDADRLMSVLSLYRGELLPGFYNDWVTLERDQLQALFSRAMRTLLNRLLADRRWSDALAAGEQWIAQGSVPEPAYRALMIAHGALDDLPSVANVYRRCREAIQRDLDLEPSARTSNLYKALVSGQPPIVPAV
jgi:DNA-binding SARP family transcriptional activator